MTRVVFKRSCVVVFLFCVSILRMSIVSTWTREENNAELTAWTPFGDPVSMATSHHVKGFPGLIVFQLALRIYCIQMNKSGMKGRSSARTSRDAPGFFTLYASPSA